MNTSDSPKNGKEQEDKLNLNREIYNKYVSFISGIIFAYLSFNPIKTCLIKASILFLGMSLFSAIVQLFLLINHFENELNYSDKLKYPIIKKLLLFFKSESIFDSAIFLQFLNFFCFSFGMFLFLLGIFVSNKIA